MSEAMSDIVVTKRRGSASGAKGQNIRTRANAFALWATLIATTLAPLPLGSARPLAWSVWALYFGFVLLVYAFFMQRSRQPFRVGFSGLKIPAALFGLVLVWLVIQILPLGGLFGGFPIYGREGLVGTANTLSVDPSSTVLMFLRQCSYGALFFLILQVSAHPARREVAINVLLWCCLAYGLFGLVALYTGDWILGVAKWAYQGSATGPFVNRNSFATYLALGSVIATAKLARHVADRLERHYDDGPIQHNISSILLYALALLFLLAVLVATQSRMGFAAALCGSLVVIVATGLRSSRVLPIVAGGVIAAAVLTVLALSLFGESLFDRFGTVDRSSIVRGDLYQQVVELIALRQWTGFGGGTFELAFPLVHQLPVNLDLNWDKAHNSYLALWSELGVVGGTLPLLIIALLVWRIAFAARSNTADWRSRCMALGAVTVAAVHSLADFSLEIQANTMLFVAILALGFPAKPEKSRISA